LIIVYRLGDAADAWMIEQISEGSNTCTAVCIFEMAIFEIVQSTWYSSIDINMNLPYIEA
jgi:hypothetical protein